MFPSPLLALPYSLLLCPAVRSRCSLDSPPFVTPLKVWIEHLASIIRVNVFTAYVKTFKYLLLDLAQSLHIGRLG